MTVASLISWSIVVSDCALDCVVSADWSATTVDNSSVSVHQVDNS